MKNERAKENNLKAGHDFSEIAILQIYQPARCSHYRANPDRVLLFYEEDVPSPLAKKYLFLRVQNDSVSNTLTLLTNENLIQHSVKTLCTLSKMGIDGQKYLFSYLMEVIVPIASVVYLCEVQFSHHKREIKL